MNEESQLGDFPIEIFGKLLLKLTRNSKSGIEVVIGGKPFVIAFSDTK